MNSIQSKHIKTIQVPLEKQLHRLIERGKHRIKRIILLKVQRPILPTMVLIIHNQPRGLMSHWAFLDVSRLGFAVDCTP